MHNQPIVVQLELLQAEGALSGWVTRPDGIVTAFAGWLGLAACLDALLSGPEEQPSRDDAAERTAEGDPQ